MGNRIKFLPGQQRKFLLRVEAASGLKADELAKIAGVVPRSYRDWRREKLNMSDLAGKIFCKRFGLFLPENEEIMIGRWKRYKSESGERGGKACYHMYGSFATQEGRRKGGAKTLYILRERGIISQVKDFDLPIEKSKQLAEFVGILLGDGGITSGQAVITLNSEADKDYLVFVVGLINSLFNFKAPFLKRKDCNANLIYCNGTRFVNYLVNLGLKVGNKVKQQVGVPNWVMAKKEYRIACLRGLIETDGGIFWHNYKVGGKIYSYKKLCFANRSKPLLNFVKEVLGELGFTPKIVPGLRVWLYNTHEVEAYKRIVGIHNPRLLK